MVWMQKRKGEEDAHKEADKRMPLLTDDMNRYYYRKGFIEDHNLATSGKKQPTEGDNKKDSMTFISKKSKKPSIVAIKFAKKREPLPLKKISTKRFTKKEIEELEKETEKKKEKSMLKRLFKVS